MKNFTHVSARSLKEASAVLSRAKGSALVVAGGTDILGALKDNIHSESPETVVDLKTIPGLNYVRVLPAPSGRGLASRPNGRGKGLRIGALTTLHEIAAHKTIRSDYRLLAEAALSVGSPQIRNMGTIAGNICQEPRCWYYRTPEDRFHCLRKGGTHCGALLGENRYHSIFGGVRAAAPACTAACPGNVRIADYLGLMREGRFSEAAKILLENNPFPALTGRVCPHLCEDKCVRSQFDEAVSIRAIERFLGDHILAHADEFIKPPGKRTKKKVAVVGAGPAGLAAAYYLRAAGHQVTVFDKMPRAGGLLAYGIPAHRLARDLVRRQIAALEAMGIVFKLNTQVGPVISLRGLRHNFDSVFLATGLWAQKTLKLEKSELLCSGMSQSSMHMGREALLPALDEPKARCSGSHRLCSGMDFLVDIELGRSKPPGRKVLVIGGGNVAVDVAVSARRAGARSVTMACLEARDAMPAFPAEISEAVKEGVSILPGWGPHRILETRGKIRGMELVRCISVFNKQGEFHPSFNPARKQTIEADQIILAIGQSAELGYAAGVKTGRGLIVVNEETHATNLAGVFAGGDVTSGPASVIHAITAGRAAARAIDAYLMGGTNLPEESVYAAAGPSTWFGFAHHKPLRTSPLIAMNVDCHTRRGRVEPSETKDLSPDAMHTEAGRCIDCTCVAVNASDLAPALAALGARIKTTKRTVAAGDFFTAVPVVGIPSGTTSLRLIKCRGHCPPADTCGRSAAVPMKTTVLDPGELIEEIMIPAPRPDSRQRYLKFRIRNAIDFPIASLAAVFNYRGGKFKDARFVLGAMAPIPLRLSAVEEFLEGKTASVEVAARAAEIAVHQARPLAKNRYKVQIVKALLQKAIMEAPGDE